MLLRVSDRYHICVVILKEGSRIADSECFSVNEFRNRGFSSAATRGCHERQQLSVSVCARWCGRQQTQFIKYCDYFICCAWVSLKQLEGRLPRGFTPDSMTKQLMSPFVPCLSSLIGLQLSFLHRFSLFTHQSLTLVWPLKLIFLIAAPACCDSVFLSPFSLSTLG